MPSFLSPLIQAAAVDGFRLVNARSGDAIAERLLTAFDSASRNRGLLKHTSLPQDTAMILAPCNSIHTFFMKFAIDVIFVARDGRVLKVKRQLPAWRVSAAAGAFATIEMMGGATDRSGISKGDTLVVVPTGSG